MSKSKTYLVGKGHGGNTPNLPVIRELLPENMTPHQQFSLAQLEPGTRIFRMGKCRIFLSPPYNGSGWHLSISREDRYPDWDEIAHAWYTLVPDAEQRTGAMLLPPSDQYINIHNYCFQLRELSDFLQELPNGNAATTEA